MYKVLLVDDEPLVLSGIKFLIDWNQLDCMITQTARNGRQALELIEQERPDIVVCDINMPVMSGLEVLKASTKKQSVPVFIMLTNHQEFDMARESLQYKAVDYLLKTQLEEEVLKNAIRNAIEECEKRKSMSKLHQMNAVMEEDKTRILTSCLQNLLKGKLSDPNNESYRILEENHYFDCFCLVQILLDYSVIPDDHRFTQEDFERIFGWEHELLETIVPKIFPSYHLAIPEEQNQRVILFIWNIEQDQLDNQVQVLYRKLTEASVRVTPARVCLFQGEIKKKTGIFEALNQIDIMNQQYYKTEEHFMRYEPVQATAAPGFQIHKETNKLILAIRTRNLIDCRECFSHIEEAFENRPHEKPESLAALIELYSSVCGVYANILPPESIHPYFARISIMVRRISQILTKRSLLVWLKDFENHVLNQLEQMTGTNSDLIDKVRGYIIGHTMEKLTLTEIADFANVSPGYLSALFKKHCGQNLTDYINEIKMNKACELIREGRHKIYEISYLLSFENAYYFTKVFKRYIGMTPKEYQNKCKKR